MNVSTRFAVGCRVRWTVDDDEGLIVGLIPQHAIAVRWESTNRTFWHSLFSGAMDRIEWVGDAEEAA